jgi:hypothetical protein
MHIIKVWMRNVQDNGYGSSGSPPTTMARSLCTNKTGGDALPPLSTAFVIAHHAVNNGLERKPKISTAALCLPCKTESMAGNNASKY